MMYVVDYLEVSVCSQTAIPSVVVDACYEFQILVPHSMNHYEEIYVHSFISTKW